MRLRISPTVIPSIWRLVISIEYFDASLFSLFNAFSASPSFDRSMRRMNLKSMKAMITAIIPNGYDTAKLNGIDGSLTPVISMYVCCAAPIAGVFATAPARTPDMVWSGMPLNR